MGPDAPCAPAAGQTAAPRTGNPSLGHWHASEARAPALRARAPAKLARHSRERLCGSAPRALGRDGGRLPNHSLASVRASAR